MLHALGRGTPVEAGKADALAHLPTVLILGSLYLLSFDVRFDPALPFQSWVIGLSVAVLLLCKAMVLLEAWYYRERSRQAEPSTRTRSEAVARMCTSILLIGLIAAGVFFACATWIPSLSTTMKCIW